MPDVTIIYWRDIPAQVLVGSGRRATKIELPERFQVAIDRAAMRSGARDTDAYLADWRRASDGSHDGDSQEIAASVAARLEKTYDDQHLARLVEAGGKAS